MNAPDFDSFDAVYYSQQVPRSTESLTLLGLVFDRLIFPGVYLPTSEFDEDALKQEINRILALKMRRDVESIQMLACLDFSLHVKHVRDFCIFTGNPEMADILENESGQFMMALYDLIVGPQRDDFIPTYSLSFSKEFPSGNRIEHQINGPSSLAYSANALVYAAKNHFPLVNDSLLPVPGIPQTPKNSAKALATILAIESVKMVLPKLKPLSPKELHDFRAETREHVKPFRVAMLRLAKELNAALASDATVEDVQKQAKFLVETTVFPQLHELTRVINDPAKHWYRRVVDLGKAAPELATNFATMPKGLALAKILGAIAGALADVRDDQLDREQKLARSGIYYLLKLQQS